MTAKPGRKKSTTLTPEEFGRFLEWLSADREQAARLYLEIRTKLVKSFIRKGCAHSEELSDETLDRVAMIVNKELEKYSSPIRLSFGVARLVWHEYLREPKEDSLDPDYIPGPKP